MTDAPTSENPATAEPAQGSPTRVLLTGATGFVGRGVLRELVTRGHHPVCLVRDVERLRLQASRLGSDRFEAVPGGLFDDAALTKAATGADAAIHLVGIIFEHPLAGQTFQRIHVKGTQRIVDACKAAGIRRIVHMSALGARPRAASEYHRTKWIAECLVRESGLDWTLFRPSVIHGPDGEFMCMMKTLVGSVGMPVIPYFGDGQAKLQPVSVKDVAHCFVAALSQPETIGQTYELGGPEVMTWKELYRICRDTLPGAKRWKPMIGQPVWAAKLMAHTMMKLPILPQLLRFNADQVVMSQEDSVCDTAPVEKTFGIKLRDFRRELHNYAALIG